MITDGEDFDLLREYVANQSETAFRALVERHVELLSGQSRAELRTLGVALASEADRDLYCVDLSRLVSQYIGETEKNLAQVFALAEATGAVLFFDEADALFGQRTT